MPTPDSFAQIPLGLVDAPSTWEVRTEITLVEPATMGMAVPFAQKAPAPKPRATISVARGAARAKTAAAGLKAFLADFAPFTPGLKRLDEGTAQFADGASGAYVTISFQVEVGRRVVQRHLYRLDGEIMTHIVASLEERDASKLDGELMGLMTSFRPQ